MFPNAQIAALLLRHQRNESFKSRLLDTPLSSLFPNSGSLVRLIPYILYHLSQIRKTCADEYCSITPTHKFLPVTMMRRVVWVLMEMGISAVGLMYSKDWVELITQSNIALFFLFPGLGGGFTIPERILGIKFLQNYKNSAGETTRGKDEKYEIFGVLILIPILYKIYNKIIALT
jgi:hypothetical protein